MTLPVVNTIWIGDTMGSVHAACLKSFVVTGHQVFLHAYREVSDAPPGVWYADANDLLPEDKLLRYPNGSYALSSNLMRYELMRQGWGLYVDCDVFCLRPMQDADFIVGFEDDYYLNCAVLKLPPDSALVASLRSIKEGWMPHWIQPNADGSTTSLTEMPWGTSGPQALTHFVREHGLIDRALPFDVFYPVYSNRVGSFYDTGLTLANLTTPRTRYVHLYQSLGRGQEVESTPANCAMGELLAMLG
jgi:hypothetical protein